MAGTRLGRYEIIRTLQQGALTDLLLGRAKGMEGFERHVAIKRLRQEFAKDRKSLEAFVNEARLGATLHHHNIVQVHDIGQEGGQPYFAMEYVHGIDLRSLLSRLAKRNEQLPLQHVVSIVACAAAALHHAHEQKAADGTPLGIVHRDVTPANIIVGYDGNVKVVDFGIAKAAIKRIATDVGVLKGSVPYMAPEQCAGKPVDRRSDVFALGIVLYELATVRRLFKGTSEFLTMSAIVNAAVPKPSQYRQDIPEELEAIMLKALARDPAQRFQTAGDMSLALDRVATAVGVGATSTALANYMRLQFGEQKEPWLLVGIPEEDAEPTLVDFDGGASGLAPPADEAAQKNAIPRSIAATKSSPIARAHAMTPVTEPKTKTELPSPRGLKKKTTPPPVVVDPGTLVPDLERLTDTDNAPTDLQVKTKLRNPPPIPPPTKEHPVATAEKPLRDPTQIVTPLPTTYPVLKHDKKSKLPWLFAAGGAAVAGVAAAIVWWPGPEVVPAAAPAPEVAKAEPAPDEPTTPTEAPSGMQMTMRDYEKAKEAKEAKQAEARMKEADTTKVATEAPGAPTGKEDAKNPGPAETTEPKKTNVAAKTEPKQTEVAAKTEPKQTDVAAKTEPKKTEVAKTEPNKTDVAAKTTTTKTAKTATTEPKKTDVAAKTTKTPTTPKRTTTKAAPAKRVEAKKPPAKKPAKKKWNPDDLFLDDK